jgi:hypothetical protein
MENYEKILDLSSELEASLLEEVLKDRNIPYGIVPATDSAIGSLWQMESGWGYVEAPLRYKEEIVSLYEEIVRK